jgi:putative NADH-flavin reductase
MEPKGFHCFTIPSNRSFLIGRIFWLPAFFPKIQRTYRSSLKFSVPTIPTYLAITQAMEEQKNRVLVVGGTGFMGRRLVRASLAQGHPTFVLMRPEIGVDVDKLQMLLSFKAQGARLVEASLEDHAALVAAVSQVDVVVSAMSGAHIRSHNLQLQHKIVEAIKEAGNVKVN